MPGARCSAISTTFATRPRSDSGETHVRRHATWGMYGRCAVRRAQSTANVALEVTRLGLATAMRRDLR